MGFSPTRLADWVARLDFEKSKNSGYLNSIFKKTRLCGLLEESEYDAVDAVLRSKVYLWTEAAVY